jgi:hypothetical protein
MLTAGATRLVTPLARTPCSATAYWLPAGCASLAAASRSCLLKMLPLEPPCDAAAAGWLCCWPWFEREPDDCCCARD